MANKICSFRRGASSNQASTH